MKFIGTDYERDIKQSLMTYLPRLYRDSRTVNEIMRVDSNEIEEVFERVNDVFKQFFVETATWGLDIWEKEFGIVTDRRQDFNTRRARIKSKITSSGTFTKADALALTNQYSSPKTSEFIEIPYEYAFKTRTEINSLVDYEGLKNAFEEMKPAHLEHIVGFLIVMAFYPRMEQRSKLSLWLRHQKFGVDKIDTKAKYKLKATMLGYTYWYDVPRTDYLYTNGAFIADGAETLDGLNPKGVNLYNLESERYKNYDNLNKKLVGLLLNYIVKITYDIDAIDLLKLLLKGQEFGMDKTTILSLNKGVAHFDFNELFEGVSGVNTVKHKAQLEVDHEIISKKTKSTNHINYDPYDNIDTGSSINSTAKVIGQGHEIEPVPDYETLYTNRGWALDGTLQLDGENNNGIQLYLTSTAIIKVTRNGQVTQEFIY